MARKSSRKRPSAERIEEAERQVIEYSRTVKFTVTEYSFEFIIQNTLGRMIGNAVPVLLGEFIGNILVEHVKACRPLQ